MDKLQRIDYLRRLVEAQEKRRDKHTYTVRWKDEDIHPTVIRVDVSFLCYRLESGRTRRKQIEYLEKNPNAPRDLFGDPESGETQKAQHQILLKMIDERGLRSDIIRDGQRDPAIIIYDGYVLNGNRRLAALRDENIQFMDCVVLPEEATRRDLYELELDLQMSEETKAEYNWVDELLHMRYGIDILGEDELIVAKKMRIGKKDVEHKLNILRLVDIYLVWLGKKGQYHIVEEHRQVFSDLEKFTRKLKEQEKQKAFREQVFALIMNPPDEGRLYDHARHLFRDFNIVQKKIFEDLEIDVEEKKEVTHQGKELSDDLFGELAEAVDIIEEETVISETSFLFDTPESAKENVSTLIYAIGDAEAERREKKDKRATFRTISEIQRKLQGITIDSTTSEIEAIYKKLDEIILLAKELMIDIGKIKNDRE